MWSFVKSISILTNATIREGFIFPPNSRLILFLDSSDKHAITDIPEDSLCIIADDLDPYRSNDIASSEFTCFTEKQGKAVLDYIRSNLSAEYWFVSCKAGVSRSSACALFLCKYFNEPTQQLWARHPWIRPNNHIYSILCSLVD